MNGRALAALSGQEAFLSVRKAFVWWLGYVPDALLLDQALYWQDEAGAGAWWRRSDPDVAEHLCMSVHALTQARARLKASKLLESDRFGTPARMHYRMDADAVAAAFLAWVEGGMVRTSSVDSQNLSRESAEPSLYKEGVLKGTATAPALPEAPLFGAPVKEAKPRKRKVKEPLSVAELEEAEAAAAAAAVRAEALRVLFGECCGAMGLSPRDLGAGNRAQIASLAARILDEPEDVRPGPGALAAIYAEQRRRFAWATRPPTVSQFREGVGEWLEANRASLADRDVLEAVQAAADAERVSQEAEQRRRAESPAGKAWTAILEGLRLDVPEASFNAWLRGTYGDNLDTLTDTLWVRVASEQAATWIGNRAGVALNREAHALGLSLVRFLWPATDVGSEKP